AAGAGAGLQAVAGLSDAKSDFRIRPVEAACRASGAPPPPGIPRPRSRSRDAARALAGTPPASARARGRPRTRAPRRPAPRRRAAWPAACEVCAGEHWQGLRMLSGFAPRTAAGHGIPAAGAGTSWRARLPVALVVLTLVALLAVPVVVSRRGDAIRAEVAEVADPARLLVNQLELSLARAAAAIRGYIIDGDRTHLEQYRAARAQEARALAALRPLVERLDAAAAPQLARIEALLVQWHMRQDRLAAGRMTPPEYTAVLPVQDELYQEVLNATGRLRDTIVAQVNERRRESAAIQRLGVVLTSILVVMAFVSILFVLRLGRRLERRGQELAASEARERFLSEAAR